MENRNKPLEGFSFHKSGTLVETDEDLLKYLYACSDFSLNLFSELGELYDSFNQGNPKPTRLNFSAKNTGLIYLGEQLIANSWDSIYVRKFGTEDREYKGIISVTLSADSGRLTYEVEDNGIGVDTRVEPFLFKRLPKTDMQEDLRKAHLTQTAGVRLCGSKGLGLGQLSEAMTVLNGNCGYQNKGSFQGARFWFSLPLVSIIERRTR